MKVVVFALCALSYASTAIGAPVTWQDSGFLTYVINPPLFPGLTVGTPWSLAVTFDPAGPFTPAAGGGPNSNCNVYASQSTTLTLGGFTYANGGGSVWTNSLLPGNSCAATSTGAIQFDWVGGWTVPPGAWDLNIGVLIAGYTDAVTSDGSLPSGPTPSGFSTGVGFYSAATGATPVFQANRFEPALVVAEPGTLMLVGLGVACGLRRLRRAIT